MTWAWVVMWSAIVATWVLNGITLRRVAAQERQAAAVPRVAMSRPRVVVELELDASKFREQMAELRPEWESLRSGPSGPVTKEA